MTQPDRTHHQRVLHHLRNATERFAADATKSIEGAAAHLEKHTPTPPPDSSIGESDATENTD